MILTRAVGREACSPGRIRLVLVQFICRCVQHHQEEKSASQRHRPLSTEGDGTQWKETPPALCVLHKEEIAPKACALEKRTDVCGNNEEQVQQWCRQCLSKLDSSRSL